VGSLLVKHSGMLLGGTMIIINILCFVAGFIAEIEEFAGGDAQE